MSITGYSNYFKRELDISQLLELIGSLSSPPQSFEVAALPEDVSTWIYGDVTCPSCGVVGATLVKGAKSKKTRLDVGQAHFRFIGKGGLNAHLRFCEFSDLKDPSSTSENTINFRSAKDKQTKIVRTLICIGIEQGMFSQADIRAMRQWFFDLKRNSRFKVEATKDALDFCVLVSKFQGSYQPSPIHGELPGFDWTKFGKWKVREEYSIKFGAAFYLLHKPAMCTKAGNLIGRFQKQEVFDTSILEPYYKATIELCTLFGKYCPILGLEDKYLNFIWDGAPAAMLALSALLLHISDWDLNLAILKLGALLKAPMPNDLTLGNVIGLNPFHDYLAWELVKLVEKIAKEKMYKLDYEAEVATTIADLRVEHMKLKIGLEPIKKGSSDFSAGTF